MQVEVCLLAYAKAVLHACKYPHKAVNGILLGSSDRSTAKTTLIDVQDAVPLSHLALGLTPMLELALTQIEIYGKEKDMKIVGYYQANEHLKDARPNLIAQRISDKISDILQLPTCLLMIENEKLKPNSRECALKAYDKSDGKSWKESAGADRQRLLVGEAESINIVSELVRREEYRKVIDFDQHLDDLSKDWTNPIIEETVRLASRGL